MVKNLFANTGDMGSGPGLGGAHVAEQQSPCSEIRGAMVRRGPTPHNEEQALLSTARESPCPATNT